MENIVYRIGTQVLRMQLITVQHTPEEFGLGRMKPPSHVVCENDDFAFSRFWPAFLSRGFPFDFMLRREDTFLHHLI